MSQPPNKDTVVFRFAGGDIGPSVVRSHDLADVLKAIEDLVAITVLDEHQEFKKEDIILGLSTVTSESLGLGFSMSLPQLTFPAVQRVADVVRDQAFDRLPYAARRALREIASFTRKYRCVGEMRFASNTTPLAIITPDLVVTDAARLTVRTTVYGRVVNAGGKNPNVHLELLDGSIVICSGSREQVKALAGRLYTVVGVTGEARCDVETYAISDFEIDEVLPYEDTPITEAMEQLSALVGEHYDGVDVEEYMRDLRGE